MKTFSKIFVFIAFLCAFPAFAQRGFDTYNAVRAVTLAPPQNIGPSSGAVTNGPIDMKLFDGIGKVDIFSATNTGTTGGTLTVQLFTSPDQTNLTALANYSLVSSTTAVNYTNAVYTGLWTTNNYLLPGSISNPPVSAGFTTRYLTSPTYTNSGAITVTTRGWYEVGFNASAVDRYLYAVWVPGGTVTNFTTGAVLTSPAAVLLP